MHGVQGCLGRRSIPRTWLFPQISAPARAPSPPVLQPSGNTPLRAEEFNTLRKELQGRRKELEKLTSVLAELDLQVNFNTNLASATSTPNLYLGVLNERLVESEESMVELGLETNTLLNMLHRIKRSKRECELEVTELRDTLRRQDHEVMDAEMEFKSAHQMLDTMQREVRQQYEDEVNARTVQSMEIAALRKIHTAETQLQDQIAAHERDRERKTSARFRVRIGAKVDHQVKQEVAHAMKEELQGHHASSLKEAFEIIRQRTGLSGLDDIVQSIVAGPAKMESMRVEAVEAKGRVSELEKQLEGVKGMLRDYSTGSSSRSSRAAEQFAEPIRQAQIRLKNNRSLFGAVNKLEKTCMWWLTYTLQRFQALGDDGEKDSDEKVPVLLETLEQKLTKIMNMVPKEEAAGRRPKTGEAEAADGEERPSSRPGTQASLSATGRGSSQVLSPLQKAMESKNVHNVRVELSGPLSRIPSAAEVPAAGGGDVSPSAVLERPDTPTREAIKKSSARIVMKATAPPKKKKAGPYIPGGGENRPKGRRRSVQRPFSSEGRPLIGR